MKRDFNVTVRTDGTDAVGLKDELFDLLVEAFPDVRVSPVRSSTASRERFVMCRPEYISAAVKNNIFMKPGVKINVDRACKQYDRIVRGIRSWGIEVLEIPPTKGCQDQTYVANIATSITPYLVLAKFSAPGRTVEEAPAKRFFEEQGYNVIQPPFAQEGEADLKLWKDQTYFAGWGKFSKKEAYDWIAKKTGTEMVYIKEISDALYHLDCSFAKLRPDLFLVNKPGIDGPSFREFEKRGECILVPPEIVATGATNIVLIPNTNIILSGMFFPEEKKYQKSMDWMNEHVGDKYGYTIFYCDIDEPDKSGADISCMVMHLTF